MEYEHHTDELGESTSILCIVVWYSSDTMLGFQLTVVIYGLFFVI